MRRPLLALLTAALIGTGANAIGGSGIALAAEARGAAGAALVLPGHLRHL